MKLAADKLLFLYNSLLSEYGPQGWWPIGGRYHPNDFSIPKNSKQRFEIVVGAVLTQNTSWKNVEKALENLRRERLLSPDAIINTDIENLEKLVKPSGYYRQKARRLKDVSIAFLSLDKQGLSQKIPDNLYRSRWLGVRGVGEETADSILLYAYKRPKFIADAYTRRFAYFKKLTKKHYRDCSYSEIQRLFEIPLSRVITDRFSLVKIFQEYHALIVEWGKRNKNLK